MNNYIYLIKQGLVEYQSQYLKEVKKEIVENKYKNPAIFLNYFNQLLSDRQYRQARDDLYFFQKEGLLTKEIFSELENHISEVQVELEINFSFN